MGNYYSKHLAGARLEQVYEIASPRIRQYLRAESDHVRAIVSASRLVLELGCGYGRAMKEIVPFVGREFGVDVSRTRLRSAAQYLRGIANHDLVWGDAVRTGLARTCSTPSSAFRTASRRSGSADRP